MRTLYLTLAIVGTLVPYAFFFQYFQSEGVDLGRFVTAWFANPAAGGATADLLISCVVFWIYMFREGRAHDAPKPYLFLALNLFVGLSCAFPAYLYASERQRS